MQDLAVNFDNLLLVSVSEEVFHYGPVRIHCFRVVEALRYLVLEVIGKLPG